MMKNVQSAILTEACQLRRMAWIDNAKTIGIGLMIVDHFLIYFGNESHW
ncbi:MAG: fucose 4-O-acetylase-like acetyltransferase, partial [Verrucomicrobiales bacterium]